MRRPGGAVVGGIVAGSGVANRAEPDIATIAQTGEAGLRTTADLRREGRRSRPVVGGIVAGRGVANRAEPDIATIAQTGEGGLRTTADLRREGRRSRPVTQSEPGVDLYWLPLGAGGHSVRLNGRLFEAVLARLERREPCDLYHSALEVRVAEDRYVVEQAPVRDGDGRARGVVAQGAVGSRWAGCLRMFRYEVRLWSGGIIPDLDEAVDSPQRLTNDPAIARRVVDLTPRVPTPVWGRDDLAAGEMWNSNSTISWLLASSGLRADAIRPPLGGRAPGWDAGLVAASRQAGLRPAAIPPTARRAP